MDCAPRSSPGCAPWVPSTSKSKGKSKRAVPPVAPLGAKQKQKQKQKRKQKQKQSKAPSKSKSKGKSNGKSKSLVLQVAAGRSGQFQAGSGSFRRFRGFFTLSLLDPHS